MPTNPDPTPPGGGGAAGAALENPQVRAVHREARTGQVDQFAPRDAHASIRYLRELLHEMNQVILELETELEGPAHDGP